VAEGSEIVEGAGAAEAGEAEAGEAAVEPEAARAEGGETELVFPADPAPAFGGKIQLPASGTAEEILSRAEARALAPDAGSLDPIEGAVASALALAEPQRAASISFFSAPAREERAAVEATEHLATFFLDREEYGVDVRLVEGFRRVTQITPVPRAPAFIRGVINLRGRIIPVVDLKKKLGLGEVQESRAARIAVVKIQDRLIGMLVDGASQVLKVPVSSIEPAPDEVVEKGGDYIRGVAKLEKRLIILVDLHRILILDGRAAPVGAA
jgi:purine-binding chemotaxis protein CheW